MIPVFKSKGVYGHIDGTDLCPPPSHPNYDAWVQIDYQILSWIHATISTDILQMIIQPGKTLSAKEAWDAIHTSYQNQLAARKMLLQDLMLNIVLLRELFRTDLFFLHLWSFNLYCLLKNQHCKEKNLPVLSLLLTPVHNRCCRPRFTHLVWVLQFLRHIILVLSHDLISLASTEAVEASIEVAVVTSEVVEAVVVLVAPSQILIMGSILEHPLIQGVAPHLFSILLGILPHRSTHLMAIIHPISVAARDCTLLIGTNIASLSSAPTALRATTFPTAPDSKWYIDSGANTHVSSALGNLSHSSPYSGSEFIQVGNGQLLPVTHSGNTVLSSSSHSFKLNNVLVSPYLHKNLISVRQFTKDNNCSVEFDSSGSSVKDIHSKNVLLHCNSAEGLYFVSSSSQSHPTILSTIVVSPDV
ncbi:hypothetical protein SLEP1_g43978 [Rubroshorea leprosula]|uniref:Retrovirus-related Pol polyprotein from transposon TNT 1-94-like beta-barrel domain-containing protein n=1 Tax=Rubroshorea leprosula TaxID=152421 RepID=A0AAV5LEU5_9ROSI|nr:hypothetical protein SLEP1_g43978 [Rubroshorea leprosula]